jgi:hypothetical protein
MTEITVIGEAVAIKQLVNLLKPSGNFTHHQV